MLLPSEIEAKSLIPAIRSILARKLIKEFHLKEEVGRMVEDIARDLAANKAYTPSTMAKFVQLCNYMRYTFIICDVHHSIESNIDSKVCEQCEVILMGSRL